MTDGLQTPASTVVASLLEDLDQFSRATTERLRVAIPTYEAVPIAEHQELVRNQMWDILNGVAHGVTPSAEQIAKAEELGWRRASQGVPVHDVIEAYHICYREMWSALVERASGTDGGAEQLVGAVEVLWTWTHRFSGAVAKAHAEALRTRSAEEDDLRRRFFDALTTGQAEPGQTERLASALGFDPAGPFYALCLPALPAQRMDPVGKRLRSAAGVGAVQYTSRQGITVVLAQGINTDTVIAALADDRPAVPMGVGTERTGLDGAAQSIRDADQALALAQHESEDVVRFDDVWMVCMLFEARKVLAEPLDAGVTTARRYPELAETVLAYAANAFRVSDCARSLHLHPNSAKYRLDRWSELTGWNVLTFEGLLRSLMSIRLFVPAAGAGQRPRAKDL
jgi:hypothetical protein